MAARVGPPATPGSASGWASFDLSTHGGFVIRGAADGYVYLPRAPRVARDAEGGPRVALTLVLARMPTPTDASIAPLIISGSLALVCTFATDGDIAGMLEAKLGARCTPFFVRSGSSSLRDEKTVYVSNSILGIEAQWWLGVSLPPQPALDVLYAFDRVPSALRVFTELPGGPPVADVPLDALLGGILDGLDRSRYLSMIVVNADGTATPVPPLKQHLPGRAAMRGAPAAMPLVKQGARLVSLPFAMTANQAVRPSAAALIAGDATTGGAAVSSHAHIWIGNDAVIAQAEADTDAAPTEHYPLISNATAPYWLDALDDTIAWYPPAFALVTPSAGDDPANSAFSFVLSKTGAATMGSGGTVQAGLTATVRLTVKQVMSPETAAALAAQPGLKPQPVSLQNLSCALEIPYRQSGSNTVLTQRFPGTLAQSGDRIMVTVGLLDDWVRLSYSALAYPTAGMLPRIIIDYAFMSYAYIFVVDSSMIGGGIVHHLPMVNVASELPSHVVSPILVRRDLTVVGPNSSLQYLKEAPGAPRGISNVALSPAAITVARPEMAYAIDLPRPDDTLAQGERVEPGVRRRVLVTRSLVREETVDASFACASYGNFYLQKANGGGIGAIGCQDSLKLGETALHAFDEVAALRDPAFRVYRSLQQPGRFLVSPAAFRVGRYSGSAGDKAFRPMIILYGVLDSDPTKNRYALTATLIPDVPPSALAKLTERLAGYTPAGTTPVIVYPTDPFVAAKVNYAWAVPQGLDTPQALTVLDSVNVTLSMPLADAALLTAMIDRSGVQGLITFTLPDGTAINAALAVDGNVIGPPESGPVTVTIQSGRAQLQNLTQQPMNVSDIVTVTASGATRTVPVNATLAPRASTSVTVDQTVAFAFANATAAAPATIDELDVFVEDVTATVTFINQVNFANHQLSALAVQAQLKNSSHTVTANLPEGKTVDLSFTLPITNYLAQQTLQYALVETKASASLTTAWRDWDLNKGTVIGVTADQL
jgi:hypothetical protein